MPRQKGDSRIRLVVVVVVVVVMVVVVVVVSASAATTMPQRIKKRGGHFSTGVLSLHEGVILLQLEGVLFLRSGVIFLRRIMTRVIPLRSKMTGGGSFCKGGHISALQVVESTNSPSNLPISPWPVRCGIAFRSLTQNTILEVCDVAFCVCVLDLLPLKWT